MIGAKNIPIIKLKTLFVVGVLTFFNKGNEDTVKSRGDCKIIYPNCDKAMIQRSDGVNGDE